MSSATINAVVHGLGIFTAGYFVGYLVAHFQHIRSLHKASQKRRDELRALTELHLKSRRGGGSQ